MLLLEGAVRVTWTHGTMHNILQPWRMLRVRNHIERRLRQALKGLRVGGRQFHQEKALLSSIRD